MHGSIHVKSKHAWSIWVPQLHVENTSWTAFSRHVWSRSADSFEAVTINNKPIEVVTGVKQLGLTISNNLKWNTHIDHVIKKGASRLYQLRQLKRAKVDLAPLVCFSITCIRPVTEYVCQVFHDGLPLYLSDELERIQWRAIRIIFPE